MVHQFTQSLFIVLLATAVTAAPAPAPAPCKLDNVCFVLDRSGSMDTIYTNLQDFTLKVADELSKRTVTTSYSAYGFADAAVDIINPTTDVSAFKNAVNDPVTPDGSTNMYAGVIKCYNALKGASGNKVLVLVTDGLDNGSPKALSFKKTVEEATIAIVTVGIGSSVDEAYLRSLATKPEFYVQSSADALPAQALTVMEKTCNAAVVPLDSCQKAYEVCKLRFRKRPTVPTYNLAFSKDNKPFTNTIISKVPNMRVGILNSNDITPEFIDDEGNALPITDFGSQPFTPTHFKPFSRRMKSHVSGIGHQTFQGNQGAVARGKCVRVYFSTFQVLAKGPKPRVVKNMNVMKTDNYCVVFKTK